MSGAPCPGCGNELASDGRCIICAPTRELPGPGTTLVGERYRLKRLLGAGGMGEVWLADDLRLETEVAIKFIAPHMAADESARRRFFREILIARQVRHPNVAAVYELQEEGDRRFFTMEYIPGQTLGEAVIAKRDLDTITSIAADLCRGLAALHQAGIVHRDVKPHNVKLKPDGQAVLLDMGIARGPGSDVTATGWVVGTPNHMAPEQAAGRAVSPATDIYGVGLVLYRLLAGGDAIQQREQSNASLPPPSTHNPEVPEWLDRVVMACIHPDPNKRYQDAGKLLLDLDARCKSATGTTVTVTRHALAGAGVGLAVLLAIAAATGIWIWSRTHSPQSFEPQRLTYRSGLQSGGVLSPDGRQVTFAASDEEGSFDLFLATVGYPGEIALTRTPETHELQPALSRDGAQLAFVAHGRQTRVGVMPATGGSVRWLTAAGYRPRWSPDDQALVLQTSQPSLHPRTSWCTGSMVPSRTFPCDRRLPSNAPSTAPTGFPPPRSWRFWAIGRSGASICSGSGRSRCWSSMRRSRIWRWTTPEGRSPFWSRAAMVGVPTFGVPAVPRGPSRVAASVSCPGSAPTPSFSPGRSRKW